jgi:hypothetical protein
MGRGQSEHRGRDQTGSEMGRGGKGNPGGRT